MAFLLIMITATLLGGVCGILHDQLTYGISEEYYTKFKFVQFGLENWGLGTNIGTTATPEISLSQPRFGVALVGFLATWWVGLFIGIILGLVGFIHHNGKKMCKVTVKAFVITILITVMIGIIGLAYGNLFLLSHQPSWYFPENLIDKNHFIMVGSMHNFSYFGSLFGLLIGSLFSIKQKNNEVEKSNYRNSEK